jgi:hypothetical protein
MRAEIKGAAELNIRQRRLTDATAKPTAFDSWRNLFASSLARDSQNQKNRNISREDAKAAKKKNKYLSELGVLRALAGGIPESELFHVSENLRKRRKLSSIVVVQCVTYWL